VAQARSSLLLHIVVGALLLMGSAGGASSRALKVVALGDSLTAGYGVGQADAFPVVLEKALQEKGLDVTIDNAGVSGDTTQGGADRLDWSVSDDTDAVLLELGANDALRGIDPAITRRNLETMLAKLKQRGIPVMLLGMRAPRNFGESYAAAFDDIFPALAKQYDVPLYPFFLDGVATDRALNQGDGIHPNPQGVRTIVARMSPAVEQFLRRLAK
jgi:acyl-CoA thioesterase I